MIAKIQSLQQNFNDLAERESKLSQEKLEISKERLELQNLRKKLYQTRCSLCKIGEQSKEISDLLTKTDIDEKIPSNLVFDNSLYVNNFNSKIMDNIEPVNHVHDLLNREVLWPTTSTDRTNNNGRPFEIDLDDVPNIADTSDNLLDPDLLLVKLNVLNSMRNF